MAVASNLVLWGGGLAIKQRIQNTLLLFVAWEVVTSISEPTNGYRKGLNKTGSLI